MIKKTKEEILKWANGSVWEAQWGAREWRAQSWRDSEMYDGGDAMISPADWADMQKAGITPVPINRTFPTCNFMLGSQVVGRFEIAAKGRTQKDSEIGQVMTEGIKFVSDQCEGEFLISQAFTNAIIPGIGCIAPGFSDDPRTEKVCWKHRDWKEIWWDPFSSPWWDPLKTRYVFWQRWADLDDVQSVFPNKAKEIEDAYSEISGQWKEHGYSSLMDEAQDVEERIRTLSGSEWIDAGRKRIRPVEMWYPVNELALFAMFADGRCHEIKSDMDPNNIEQLLKGSQRILRSIVKKMRVMTFFGERLILQDEPSPYSHDQYPMVPFVGYLDRFGSPYGVPRQIRGQNEEIYKRRSMSLALLQKRRVIAEKSVVKNGDRDALDSLYEEANKLDGFMVIEDGKIAGFKIEDLAQFSQYQMELLRQSELEVREISGANASALGYEQSQQSGVAKNFDLQRSNVTTASLLDNLRRSLKRVGDQTISNIQSDWTYEKVLRVTDRLTGAERFIKVNERVGGGIEVKNNITQGKFDSVVSETPASDTIREKNMDLLYAAIEKSPPEAVPTLLVAAFEMSDLPNKEMLIEKLKPVLGVEPEDENMTAEQKKQMAMEAIQAHKQQAALMAEIEQEAIKTKLNEAKLKNIELEAKIKKLEADTKKVVVDTVIAADQHEINIEKSGIEAMDKGIDIAHKLTGGNGDGKESQIGGHA